MTKPVTQPRPQAKPSEAILRPGERHVCVEPAINLHTGECENRIEVNRHENQTRVL